jgi:ABC-type uncharacterized transport system ATPase subunit
MTGLNPTNEQRSSGAAASTLAIELVGINKHFGPVHANRDIHLAVKRGTVHGIVGENGAGKSTLMSILYGFYTADSGTIHVDGVVHKITDSRHALALGIGMVHQHFMLVDNFTVLENVVLGAEDSALLKPTLNRAREHLKQLARDYGLEIDPDAIVENLSVGQQQRVEILKALYRGAETLILDEPTGVLTPAEADHLFRILGKLRAEGKTIILITHKLREIMAITDEVSVMRQGAMVKTLQTKDTSPGELAELMVGRRVLLRVEKGPANPGQVLLDVKNLIVTDDFKVPRVKNISFQVRAGEIVGIAGIVGAGRSEVVEAIFGLDPAATGRVTVKGTSLPLGSRDAALAAGVGLVPEDRKRQGLVLGLNCRENTCLAALPALTTAGWVKRSAERELAERHTRRLRVKAPSLETITAGLSGGNQQKIALAKWLARSCDVLLIDEPTRGVDVGAKAEIYQLLDELACEGKALLVVSSELPELIGLCRRIIVMRNGGIAGEVPRADFSEAALMRLMAGVAAA